MAGLVPRQAAGRTEPRTSAEILEDRDRRRDSMEGPGHERTSGSKAAPPRRRAADAKTTTRENT
jgi:hypothetical protein